MKIKKYKQPLYESFDFDEKKDDSIDKEFEERLKQISFNKKFEESIKIGLDRIVKEYADKDGLIVTDIMVLRDRKASIPEKYTDILTTMFYPIYKNFNILGKNGWTLPKLDKDSDGHIIVKFIAAGQNRSLGVDGNAALDIFIKDIMSSLLWTLSRYFNYSAEIREKNKLREQLFLEISDKFKFFDEQLLESFTFDSDEEDSGLDYPKINEFVRNHY